MNTRDIATEYRLTHWAGIMRERQESGLSIKTFCEQSGFHENVYFYWQRKLREAACKALLPAAREEPATAVVPSGLVARSASCSPMPPGWAIVNETPKVETENNVVYIKIGKSRIEAVSGVDTEHLAKVCRMLMSLC
ncbi:MAG: IS66 family insertion sequence element accessory protein TnpB [Oscillospiraceae bacterium]|nr:IS66 family insertion sequence element accessory protein TnpB [Oscillospiraceae bacterium]